jgi:opacity protein-like surface antigen
MFFIIQWGIRYYYSFNFNGKRRMDMKKIILVVLTAFLIITTGTAAFARQGEVEVDGALSLGTGPSDFDSAVGFNFGVGFMIQDNPQLQIRGDLSYYDFDASMFGVDVSYTRMPIAVSARIYIPVQNNIKVFGQGGLELSFDEAEVAVPWITFGGPFGITPISTTMKQKVDETNIGITPGGGIEFMVNPQFGLFAMARWHIISDNYFDLSFGGAVHF